MYRLVIILCAALSILSACHNDPPSTMAKPISAVDTLEYEIKVMKKNTGVCEDTAKGCATVEFDYPVFAGDSAADINNWILGQMGEGYMDTLIHNNMADVMQQFLDNYTTTIKSLPDNNERWAYRKSMSVEKQSPDIISLHVYIFEFAGGAHPNESDTTYHYDRKLRTTS